MTTLDRSSAEPYYRQIYNQIALGIDAGQLPAGKKLPSIRDYAQLLGVSNTTIVLAYQKLAEEGYVEARRGSGYIVCGPVGTPKKAEGHYSPEYHEALASLLEDADSRESACAYDFSYDAVDATLFPVVTWARISREVFFEEASHAACLYNDPQGLLELRAQIVQFLALERGMQCYPEQILVMPTTRNLVSTVLDLLDDVSTVVMENPGYDEVHRMLSSKQYDVVTLDSFPNPAWNLIVESDLSDSIVFVTPTGQFPIGQVMRAETRKALVDWAQRTNSYVINDEYGWEFQPLEKREPSLATFDRTGRVITIGTFSNSFTPAVSLSFAVLPPQLMIEWRKRYGRSHPQTAWQTQAAMASFMKNDHWRSHIRKMRTAMHKKYELAKQSVMQHMGDAVNMIDSSCNRFFLMQTNDGKTERELIDMAASAGVRVYPTSGYWMTSVPDEWRYVLVGFAGIPKRDIEPGIETLAKAWGIQ